MLDKKINLILGILGMGLMMTFVIGLSISISRGFAGFWGGLPFTLIITFVIGLALYEFWEETLKKKKD